MTLAISRRALLATAGAAFLARPLAAQSADPRLEEMVLGSPDAPVEIIEYASMTCPHCARFHVEVLPKLKAEYIEPGKVRLVLREVYFDRFGLWATMVARCGGATRYFGIVDEIFRTQKHWARAGDDAAVARELRRIGRLANLTEEELNACLSDQEFANALVRRYQEQARRDGIDSTPTFLINGQKTPNLPWEDLKSRIDAALG
ncbi:MAG: thiol-disulfide oxidoreductase [Paracoccaceae bacterium]|nr:MAG: DsbA family protein [Alphaproteobacteria bacterium]GIX12391.1 MAG: thiol-disulfide oxidoreductase [Paracoccaceae bacterium]